MNIIRVPKTFSFFGKKLNLALIMNIQKFKKLLVEFLVFISLYI